MREEGSAGSGCAPLGIGLKRPGSTGIVGVPKGVPKLGGNGAGAPSPPGEGRGADGGSPAAGGIAPNGAPPGDSKIGPSPQSIPMPAPTIGTPPPPQLLQHSHGQARRPPNKLIRRKPPPPQPPQGLAHPVASTAPSSVAEVAKRNQFMCGPLVANHPRTGANDGCCADRRRVSLFA